ncbi:5-oxoprolinase/urea amidolyase family protein [Pantoea sp. Tr-811]|uniref:5-oxoprolinase subunit B/C family protein n=1 Tax=Pantoea sp. Tr-811 TaxID=2608361 RepID=UPI001420BABE|nr:urea amidolyase family protein [Pantoea sp. Tr-811]NIF29384.1 5-oxoprolinase/urea amidolyase family protein [Pantoea sp. Tr-811]
MSKTLQFLPAGSNRFIVELDDLESTIALGDALKAACFEGLKEVVPGAVTLHVSYDPFVTTARELYAQISSLRPQAGLSRSGDLVEIPMVYDGEDLAFVADYLGWSVEQLIRRHQAATFTVAFTGFAPGFAYMTCDDPELDVPRRDSPRVRIPAGSVALAGRFCGVYPSDTPGGWQLLGATVVPMWDVSREQAALLKPGDRVRFVEAAAHQATGPVVKAHPALHKFQGKGFRVVGTDRPILFQDLGRAGNAHQGVSQSGAADLNALRLANELLGNSDTAVALEVTYGGAVFEAELPLTVAVTGAAVPLALTTADGRVASIACSAPVALNAGDTLALGVPSHGVRSYVALRGGLVAPKTLGSASTDTLAKVGPEPIFASAVLQLANDVCGSVCAQPIEEPKLPASNDIVVLDVVMGPRTDWFTPEAIRTFTEQAWKVTPESNRVGVRLNGASALTRECADELPSEGTSRGAIQVPRNGQPVLFLADHPLTGGYPVIAVVAEHHLSLAAQIPIGARIRFNAIAGFDPQVKETER